MAKYSAIVERVACDLARTYFGEEYDNITDARMGEEYYRETEEDPCGEWVTVRWLVLAQVAKTACNWVDGVGFLLPKGLEITSTKMVPARDPNTEDSMTEGSVLSGIEVTIKVGHFNGLDDRGVLDGAIIKKAFIWKEGGFCDRVEDTNFYTVEPS